MKKLKNVLRMSVLCASFSFASASPGLFEKYTIAIIDLLLDLSDPDDIDDWSRTNKNFIKIKHKDFSKFISDKKILIEAIFKKLESKKSYFKYLTAYNESKAINELDQNFAGSPYKNSLKSILLNNKSNILLHETNLNIAKSFKYFTISSYLRQKIKDCLCLSDKMDPYYWLHCHLNSYYLETKRLNPNYIINRFLLLTLLNLEFILNNYDSYCEKVDAKDAANLKVAIKNSILSKELEDKRTKEQLDKDLMSFDENNSYKDFNKKRKEHEYNFEAEKLFSAFKTEFIFDSVMNELKPFEKILKFQENDIRNILLNMNDKTREKLYKIYSDYKKAKISNKKPVNNELKEKIIQLSAIFTTTCKHDKNKYKDVIAIIKKYLKSNFPEFTAAFIKEEQNQFILNKAYKITKDINNKQNYNKEHKEYFSKNINYILEQIEDETREKLYKIYSDYENNGSVDAKIKDEIICLTITLNTSIERQRQLIKECQNHSSIEAILKSYLTDNFPGYAVKK